MKITKRLIAFAAAVGVAAGLTVGVSTANTVHPDIQRSWTEAVQRGLIQGDPAYYYNGQATQYEINHALLTAILKVDTQSKP